MTNRMYSRRAFIGQMGKLGFSLAAASVLLDACDSGSTTAVLTSFFAGGDGFNFVNSFTNDLIPALDVHTGGLCGGMCYTALDYYNFKTPIPNQAYQPASGTVLYNDLYNRQKDSILNNLDKWAEIGFNPGGARNSEFFNWGLQSSARIGELRGLIDAGKPAVLGLQGAGSEGNHQVVATGYDMGQYKGDLGANESDFMIFVYDPNYPGQQRTLIPDLTHQVYVYKEGGSETWQTYLVDQKYSAQQPPRLPNPVYPNDGRAYELLFQVSTGSDDLDGGSNNVDVTLNLKDGTQQMYPNINQSARWIANNTQNADVVLTAPLDLANLATIVLSTNFPGGLVGKNWTMSSLSVSALGGGGLNRPLATSGPYYFQGGAVRTLTITPVP